MKKRQFVHILRKYRQGTATEEERRFVESYYDLLETGNAGKDPGRPEDEKVKEDILNAVWEKILHRESEGRQKGRIRSFSFPVKMAAAAAILVLVAAGLIFYTGNGHKDRSMLTAGNEKQQYKNIIRPGGNKAVLTLADGAKVVLDSVHNGLLAQQGNTRIIKLDSGRLAYQGLPAGRAGSRKVLYNTITTPRGGQYEVVLPDGTKVWLNAATALHFPTAFTGDIRKVEVSGEAYFEVAKRAGKPFIVKAGDAVVQVLGTRFNVRAYADEKSVSATLAEGSVRVSEGNKSRLLRPGEQAGLNRQTGDLTVRQVNTDKVLAWKNGLFYFENTNIQTIMREVSRWYDVDVTYATTQLDKKIFSGIISRYSNVDALLKRLELTGTVHFRVEERNITVMD